MTLNEIRTSGDLIYSEPAIDAAQALTEEALFYNVRGTATLPTTCGVNVIGFSTHVTGTDCINYYADNPNDYLIAANASQSIYLYNPANQGSTAGATAASMFICKAAQR